MSLPLPSLAESTKVWAKIGLLSFGGPAAQIALMHREIVEERPWLSEKQFLNALSFCMLLPGPEAMQIATYAGWRLHGTLGGLVAGLLFVIPGAIVIAILALIYASFGDVPLITALFLGVKAAIIVIVIEALLRVSRKALHSVTHWTIALATFVGIFFFALPYPAIIGLAAAIGFLQSSKSDPDHPQVPLARSHKSTLATALFWLGIWILPLLALWAIAPDTLLPDIGLFFSKLAVVTFGGAYAVLAYMAQDVVNQFGWLTAGEMLDGLGLAETTPGPLILVTEFVGFLAAFKQSGITLAFVAALVTLWATFAPCFLWIFVGAPYIDWIADQPRLKGALNAITAAVVGVILNLAIWFSLHVFFTSVTRVTTGPLTLWLPDISSLDWRVIALTAISAWLIFRAQWGLSRVLLVAALAGITLTYVFPVS